MKTSEIFAELVSDSLTHMITLDYLQNKIQCEIIQMAEIYFCKWFTLTIPWSTLGPKQLTVSCSNLTKTQLNKTIYLKQLPVPCVP